MAGLAFYSAAEQADLRIKRFPDAAIGQLSAQLNLLAGRVTAMPLESGGGATRERRSLFRTDLLRVAQEASFGWGKIGQQFVIGVK